MPALNVEYTEKELAALRAAAAAAGMSLKAYVHDASLRDQQRRAFVASATRFYDEHVAEFDAAFPDEAPRPRAAAA
ncbi:hypothetical protein [Streptomyces hoynatensis]|uniref:Antitoxin MazE7 n=1 Tax=Streptomyces hoynatensis TaxID=1141874 RepID=A0A3A9YRD3_9ACTN|nr:hypothetical protein [Streptomyces hoynatensis]RKN38495.1 hypothetical protein D7294_23735 [Streptomyces hoynatensis]